MTSYQWTPLRYPGGKQRLTPFFRELIEDNFEQNIQYVEPYAGGAGVAVALLMNGIVQQIHINDSSRPVFAFWKSVVCNADDLCRLIFSASLTVED